eukprot:779244_1
MCPMYCSRSIKLCRILGDIGRHERINVPLNSSTRMLSIASKIPFINLNARTIGNSNERDINWLLLCEYAYRANLVKFNEAEIRDWLKLFDTDLDVDSICVRDVKSCGQKYITYLSYHNNALHQYVIVRGTKNWENIKTSLRYNISYNEQFKMLLHNGYGTASQEVLEDLQPLIHPDAILYV